MSGMLAVPENLLLIMPPTIVNGDRVCHDSQGLLNLPLLVCHAFDCVTSSSGRALAMVGAEMLAAKSSAAVDDPDIMRSSRVCWMVGDVVFLVKRSLKNERMKLSRRLETGRDRS